MPPHRVKGQGFFGPLARPDKRVSTELSIGVDLGEGEVEIPTLVPTLTPAEVQTLLGLADDTPIPEPIVAKAVAFARGRLAAGRPPFAEAGEQHLDRYPELPREGLAPPTPPLAYLTDVLRRLGALKGPGGR